jgi:hypothetical protein
MSKSSPKKSTSRRTPKGRAKGPKKPYPSVLFEKALQIPIQIKEKNAGRPWATDDVAAAIGMSAKSSEFFYVTAASRDFGLTALGDLGREIVYAPDAQVERTKKSRLFRRSICLRRYFITTRGAICLN